MAELRQWGLQPREEHRYGATYAVIDVPPEHLGAYFRVLERHVDDVQAWCWIAVHAMPRS